MKVLVAEDDPVTRRLLEAHLNEWQYEVLLACDGRQAWDVLCSPEPPNLVISDWMMPYVNGLELCQEVRKMDKHTYVYFIILTTKSSKKDVILALEAGADDYLVKPFDKKELQCRIKIGERILGLEQRILEMASTDFLTGVLNRRAFIERMDKEICRSIREDKHLSLILADIDSFKTINDHYGHHAGDLVLQKFTEKLSELLRPYDFIGRYGGEEFLVCLAGVDEGQARHIAERMRKKIEQLTIIVPEGSDALKITASFGVVSRSTGTEASLNSMTRGADDAMYMAKRNGKNQVCVVSVTNAHYKGCRH